MALSLLGWSWAAMVGSVPESVAKKINDTHKRNATMERIAK